MIVSEKDDWWTLLIFNLLFLINGDTSIQLYYVFGFITGWTILADYVGYGIHENKVTRCLVSIAPAVW